MSHRFLRRRLLARSSWRSASVSWRLRLPARKWRPLTTAHGEWPGYGGDTGHTRYSPLVQIDGSNFSELEIAWRFKIDNLGPAPEFKLEGTPLMAGGVLYATGGTRRAVVALDAATGTRVAGFGEDGSVDLQAAAVVGDGRPIDLVTRTLVVIGECGYHRTAAGRGAMLRAYDKATGQEVGAVFMPAPQSGSPMTYVAGGRQYIVRAVSGRTYSGEYIAFRLPS